MEKEPGLIVKYQSWWVGDRSEDRAGGYSGSGLEFHDMDRDPKPGDAVQS